MLFFLLVLFELLILFFLSRRVTSIIFLLLHTLTRSQNIAVAVFALFFYPGVLIHELAHYLMAVILFVPAGKMEFMPVFHGNGVKLGSVSIARTDPIRRMLIGVAPIIVGCLLLLASLYAITSYPLLSNYWQFILAGYLLFVLGNTMFSSKKDVEGTLEVLIGIVVVIIVLYFFGIRITTEQIMALFTPEVTRILQKASYYLTIPIAADTILLALAAMLRIRA